MPDFALDAVYIFNALLNSREAAGGVAFLIKENISHANSGCLDLFHVENISVTIDMTDGNKMRAIIVGGERN